jgi:hypothetical protein
MAADAPATTVQAREDRVGSGSPAPPGYHDEDFAIMSLPDAIILSERAAAILQGFPPGWIFSGETKKARWAQLGQAMPPALAEAVARAVVEQDQLTRAAPDNVYEGHYERACLCNVTPCPCSCHRFDQAELALEASP